MSDSKLKSLPPKKPLWVDEMKSLRDSDRLFEYYKTKYPGRYPKPKPDKT